MDLKEYQELALRTDPTDEFYGRSVLSHEVAGNGQMIKDVGGLLEDMIGAVNRIDQLKKAMVYKALDTAPPLANVNDAYVAKLRMVHAIMLISSEAGELSEAVANNDLDNIAEEIGDIMWGLALLAKANGITLEDCGKANIAKLKKRYPGEFNTNDALNRDKSSEMLAVAENLKKD